MAERCPRCLQADLIRVHAHDECPLCRYVHPCCNGETAEACGVEQHVERLDRAPTGRRAP